MATSVGQLGAAIRGKCQIATPTPRPSTFQKQQPLLPSPSLLGSPTPLYQYNPSHTRWKMTAESSSPSPRTGPDQGTKGGGKNISTGVATLGGFLAAGAVALGIMFLPKVVHARGRSQAPPIGTSQTVSEGATEASRPRIRTTVKKSLSQGLKDSKGLPGKDGKSQEGSQRPKLSKEEYVMLGEQKLAEILKKDPLDENALRRLVTLRLRQQNYQGTIAPLTQLQKMKPEQIDLSLMLAQSQIAVKDLTGARGTFEKILNQEPYNPIALQGMAAVMQQKGEGSKVLEMLEEKIAIAATEKESPQENVANLKLLLGQVHTGQGNTDEAIRQFDEAMQIQPSDFRPHLSKGLVYTMLGKGPEAQECFKKCKELLPQDYPHRSDLEFMIARASKEAKEISIKKKGVGRGVFSARKKT